MKNILLTIEYDGSEFHGWQRQPDERTVQGELERVLSFICGTDISINGASRTDAGVHAYGQRASFCADFKLPTEKIALCTNNLLSGGSHREFQVGDIRVRRAEEVSLDFHARFNAKGKKYIYRISNSEDSDIFRRNYCYQIGRALDTDRMTEAAQAIVGTHDFKCFQAAGGEEKETTVRTICSLDIIRDKSEILIEVKGDGFLYNMVRIITGTLVDVGLGKMAPDDIEPIIAGRDRQKAGHTAPPTGLYLAEVYY